MYQSNSYKISSSISWRRFKQLDRDELFVDVIENCCGEEHKFNQISFPSVLYHINQELDSIFKQELQDDTNHFVLIKDDASLIVVTKAFYD